jgi:lipoteichoic acid synthase
LPDEFKVYLNACHYTDTQIARYFANLKRRGLFDESLILILSDHNVKPEHLAMPAAMERELPVYIINGGFSRNEAWGGACNQLDVYTTILDLLKIEAPWRGLGHTLLTTDYQNSVSDDSRKWDYSEWMISSNYFNQP